MTPPSNSTPATETETDLPPTIHGRIVDVSNLTYVAQVEVGIAAVRPDGETVNVIVQTSDTGEFEIPIPAGPFTAARVAAGIDGPTPVDLEVDNGEIVPGDVIFTLAPEQGTHLRFGGFA